MKNYGISKLPILLKKNVLSSFENFNINLTLSTLCEYFSLTFETLSKHYLIYVLTVPSELSPQGTRRKIK